VSRRDIERLNDITAAIAAIRNYQSRGSLSDGLVFDAIRVRLIEIGEAVKALPRALVDNEPGVPWREMAKMRDFLAHRYFDSTHSVIQHTIDHDLHALDAAIARIRRRV
jgi:uncharacterized protein with HEPN domain